MNPKEAVSESFEELGLIPREGQDDLCREIVELMGYGLNHVFLDAPTGSGKSVIGIVVARTLGKLDKTQNRSVITTATNALARQYERDFSVDQGVCTVFGAENYPCSLRKELTGKIVTAAMCYRKSRYFHAKDSPAQEAAPRHCPECGFLKSREGKITAPIVITNYSYFMVDRLYIATMEEPAPNFSDRALYVFDEAHLFNDQFSNHNTVYFDEKRAEDGLEDVRMMFGDDSDMEKAYTGAFDVILTNIKRQSIGPKNAGTFVKTLMKFYGSMLSIMTGQAMMSSAETEYDRFSKVADKYRRLLCKTEDYFKYEFDVAVTCEKDTLAIKPIFVGDTFQHLAGKQNLFMSATLDPDFLIDTLKIDRMKAAKIRSPYRFEPDDKTLRIPAKTVPLNYIRAKDPAVLNELGRMCDKVLKLHTSDSGVVFTTSFALAREVRMRLSGTHEVLMHGQGTQVDEWVNRLKGATKPSVLISPSMFEGMDLAGPVSKFQIFVKAPYFSLGDKRISAIMHRMPHVYEKMAIMRLIQGMGRSTRFRGDKSVSYFMDTNLTRLFDSKNNSWKDQFSVQRGFAL